ncbi:hypothetical protein DKP78_22005, partial [Enterococcus faecium]
FGQVAHSLLTLFAAVHGEVVDVGSLVSHLKVADAAVPLSTQIHNAGVWIKERQKHSTARVQLLKSEGFREIIRVPQSHLSFTHSA